MGTTGTANTLQQPRTVLRFVNDPLQLNKNKRACKGRNEYFVINPTNWLMDFMLAKTAMPPFPGGIVEWGVWDYETGAKTHDGNVADLYTYTAAGKDYIMYKGLTDNGFGTKAGVPFDQVGVFFECDKVYQVHINDGYTTWYSEPFKAAPSDYDYSYEYLLDDRAGGWTTISGGGGSIVDNTITKSGFTSWRVRHYIPGNFYRNFGELAFKLGPSDFSSAGTSINIYFDGNLINTFTENTARTEDGWIHIAGFFMGPLVTVELEFNAQANGVMEQLRVFPDNYGIKCHTKLEWSHTCGDVANMLTSYDGGRGKHINYFWYDERTEISEPKYKIFDEKKDDGTGKKVTTVIRREKRYQIESELLPEYILDALFDIPLFDTKRIVFKDSTGYEEMTDVVVDYKWQFKDKCLCTTSISFGTDDDAIQGNCCEQLPVVACPEPCANVEGLYDEDTAVDGLSYLDPDRPWIIIYSDSGPNTTFECTSLWAQLSAASRMYYWDGSTWRVVCEPDSVIKEDPLNLHDTRAYIFGFLPPGYYGYFVVSPAGSLPDTTKAFTPEEYAEGILIEPGDTTFTVQCCFGTPTCGFINCVTIEVDWGLRMKLNKATLDSYTPGHWWSFLQFCGATIICTLRPSNILVPDLAALEAAIEGGVCSSGAYTFTSDANYYYIEKTDIQIVDDCDFLFLHTDDVNTITYTMLVFDRNRLDQELSQ